MRLTARLAAPLRSLSPALRAGRKKPVQTARAKAKNVCHRSVSRRFSCGAWMRSKTAMFLDYSELLNALDTGSTTKLTINNKRLKKAAPHQREDIAPAQPVDAAPDHPKGRPDQPQIKTREAAAHATPKDSGPFLDPTEQAAQTPDGPAARSAALQIKTREAVQC